MVFIGKEVFENAEKQKEISQKIENKKTLNKINEVAQADTKKGLSEKMAFKVLHQATKQSSKPPPQPKPISFKDIEREIKIHELIENKKEEQILELLEDDETKEIKGEIIDVLAMTHTHPDKHKIFKYKLGTSKTINSFVDENVIFRFLNKANNHIKFGLLYGIKYAQTHREYNEYLKLKQQEGVQQKQQAEIHAKQATESKTESE
jgi:hypothetical protein